MKTLKTSTLAIAAAATLFTGCSVDDSTYSPDLGGGSSSQTDTLSVVKTGEGFLVMWSKKAGSYGEVIYTDSLDKKRGVGYPLTANATGVYSMPCYEVTSATSGATYSCKPSNVSYRKTVSLKEGVSYKWLVSYGFGHEHGEVEATMQYSNGTLIIE